MWISALVALVSTSCLAVETTMSCRFLTANIPYLLMVDVENGAARVGNNNALLETHPDVHLVFISEDLIWKLDRSSLAVAVIRKGQFVTRGECKAYNPEKFRIPF
jgi:hypothetical protein